MALRYLAALALTLGLAAAALPGGAKPARHAKTHSSSALPDGADLYSRRALRRAKNILELKLLELRSEHLERVRRAIEQHLPVDEVLKT